MRLKRKSAFLKKQLNSLKTMKIQEKIHKCYLCDCDSAEPVSGKVRDQSQIGIMVCNNCGLVYLDSHKHITSDYYSLDYEKELFSRCTWKDYLNASKFDDDRRVLQLRDIVAKHSYLDIGCGAGGVVLGLRELCREVAVVEPMKIWRGNLKKKGIDTYSSVEDIHNRRFDIISMFHVLEHLPDPISFLTCLKSKMSDSGMLIIEVPNADDALLSLYRSKHFSEFFYWSPHLYYFNPITFSQLLTKAEYNIITMQQYQRYPLSNHLKWLAMGKGGGHLDWPFLDSPELTAAYSGQLAKLGKCDTLIAWVNLKR
jgi:2-polyprenyl-3-methyl-5-hydroxy-6-metoxy-1,4-benzoquinol methylase